MPTLPALTLHDIRNHHEQTFEFGDLTVLVGSNGSGKTNVLEAISVASTTRSWRVKCEVEMVRWGDDFGRIIAGPIEVVISRQPYRKSFWNNGVKLRAKDVVGSIRTVLFQPDDLALVTGAPQYRRHFMNVVLSQIDHEYSSALLDYAKTINQRNRLLKQLRDGLASPDEMVFWDHELCRLANIIWLARQGFVGRLEAGLTTAYQEVSGDSKVVTVRHETKPHEPERLPEELVAVRDREIILGQTLRGPHRDDLHFILDGHPAMMAASRGELRSLTFALKMIELDYLSNTRMVESASLAVDVLAAEPSADSPTPVDSPAIDGREGPSQPTSGSILLLDDIMSELDSQRRRRLVEAARRCQTILTTTDLDDVPTELRDGATIINF